MTSSGAASSAASGWAAISIVAGDELARAARSRWLFVFAASFAILALAISYFGLAGSGPAEFQSFERVTASLLNLVLLWVPLAGVLLSVVRLTGSRETLSFLLAQPLTRRSALLGKYLGLAGAFLLAQTIGFGGAGLVIAMNAGGEHVRGFLALVGLSLLLGAIFVGVGVAFAAGAADRVQALGGSLATWLVATVLYDLAIVGVTSVLYGLPVRAILATGVWLNPVDLSRVLATAALGNHALFGPTGAAVGKFLGTPLGWVCTVLTLITWLALPLVAALVRFQRRDF